MLSPKDLNYLYGVDIRELYNNLYEIAVYRERDEDLIVNAIGDTIIEILNNIAMGKLINKGNLTGVAVVTLRRRLIDHQRRCKRQRKNEVNGKKNDYIDNIATNRNLSPPNEVLLKKLVQQIESELEHYANNLTPEKRIIYQDRIIGDVSPEEVAQKCRCSKEKIYTSTNRMKEQCNKIIKPFLQEWKDNT